MSDETLKKEEILFHIEQVRNDPSYINSIDSPPTFNAVSEALMTGVIRDVQPIKRTQRNNVNNGQNDLYNQHFNKFDGNTKQ